MTADSFTSPLTILLSLHSTACYYSSYQNVLGIITQVAPVGDLLIQNVLRAEQKNDWLQSDCKGDGVKQLKEVGPTNQIS